MCSCGWCLLKSSHPRHVPPNQESLIDVVCVKTSLISKVRRFLIDRVPRSRTPSSLRCVIRSTETAATTYVVRYVQVNVVNRRFFFTRAMLHFSIGRSTPRRSCGPFVILIRSDWWRAAVLADDFCVSYAESFVSRGTRLVTLNRSICSRMIEPVTFRRQCSSLPKFRLAHCHEVLVRLLVSPLSIHIQSCSHELPLCSQLAALFLLSSNVTLSS